MLTTKLRKNPTTVVEVLNSNGLEVALCALSAVPAEQAAERNRLARLYACRCVRQVWHLLRDERSRTAIEVSERYTAGAATLDELGAARAAAADAEAAAAANAADAEAAAYAAAYADARAAGAAAAAAAYAAAAAAAAADAAASDAAYAASYAAAYDVARDAQAAKFREMFGGVTC